MKINFFLIVLISFQFVFAQEKTNLDTIKRNERDTYIKDYSRQLNIKLEVSNDIQILYIPINNEFAEVSPNMGLRYALNFNYRFLSVRFGIRPNKTEKSIENKGDTDVFDFKVQFIFNRWSQNFEYNKVKGFYIKNGDEIFPSTEQGNYIQLPDFTTNMFSGNTSYKFNDNYSLKSTQSQTEIQLKSAGSFLPNLNYVFYKIEGVNKILDKDGETITINDYSDYKGVSFVLNLSYYHNFVIKKWFVSLALNPGIGINFYEDTNYINETVSKQNITNFVVSPEVSAGVGYNADKIYFGTKYLRGFTDQNSQNSELPFKTSSRSFSAYFGYRFRAPKVISKPVRYIEEKIPILD